MAAPAFLFVELADEHANQVGLVASLAAALRAAGGQVYAAAPAGQVACLEPATIASSIVLVRWPGRESAERAAQEVALPMLAKALHGSGTVPLVLVANGLPEEGLPTMLDIPTVASVPMPPKAPRNAVMVIRGSASDPVRMEGYRDVILPMMKDRGALYEAFALQAGEVGALSGEWREQIFAISRWPQFALAQDFWFSDRYQQEAIPLRIGAGRFSVHVMHAAD